MKAKLFKMSLMTTTLIFLMAGASWADNGRHRHHLRDGKKHFHNEHHKKDGYRHRRHDKLYARHLAAREAERNALWHQRQYHKAKKHALKHYRQYRRAERHVFKQHHKNHSRFGKHSPHRHKPYYKHYRKHRSSQKIYSFRASAFEPGWSITIRTKNRW